jgi:outer membrane protein assembly factor BamB
VAADEAQPNVRALDMSTGTLLWGPIAVGSSVLLAAEGAIVFTLDGAGTLAALDVASGHPLWATQLEGQLDFESPPVAAGGLVYANGLESGGTTYAVDAQTGAVIWTAGTFDGSGGTVAVSGGVVYEAEACDQVSAFDAFTGDLKWYYSTSCTGGGGAAPAVYEGHVWVRDWALGNIILDTSGHVTGSFEATVLPSFGSGTAFYLSSSGGASTGTLTAVDVASNTVKWSFAGDGQLCTSAVVAGGGNQVFVGSQTGNVYELDETTGAQRSVSDAGSPVSCGSETQAMGLGDGTLLVPASNSLVAYGRTAAADAGPTTGDGAR